MSTSITYRKGAVEDIPAFLSFFKTSIPTLFPHYSPNSVAFTVESDYSPTYLTEKITNGGKRVYLALSDKRIVGYLLVARSLAGVSFADWLAVDKEFQRQGIAAKLISMWESEALEEGAHSLQLWTTDDYVKFYENRGLHCGGTFPKAWHGEDCYLIYKTLREPEEKNYLKKYLSSLSS